MRNQKGLGLVALAVGAGVVGISGALGYGIHKTNQRLDDAIGKADQRMGEFIRAIPGERWLQLIDDLNGPNEDKRKAAQAYLKNVAHIDISSSYEASAAFGFDNAKPIRGQIFVSGTNSREAVELYLADHEGEALRPLRSTISPTPTVGELRQVMVDAQKEMEKKAVALQQTRESCSKGCGSNFGLDIVQMAQTNYDAAVESYTDAALRAFNRGTEPAPMPADTLSVSWNPMKDQYVVVALLADDLDMHRNDPCTKGSGVEIAGKGCVRVWVHPAGKPQELAYKGGMMEFSVNDFYGSKAPVPAGVEGYPVRYAARRMDPAQMFDTNALRAYQEMVKLRTEAAATKLAKVD